VTLPVGIVMAVLFFGFLIGVWLAGVIGVAFRSITFVKSVHTIGFVVLSGVLAVLLYEVFFDRITVLTWSAIALFAAEGVVLVVNGWRCPLTAVAEKLGSTHGQVTDFFLPKWFADRVFTVYRGLFAAALLMLATRLLW
jgi:hypothetical protein